jgi:hypothetical protein
VPARRQSREAAGEPGAAVRILLAVASFLIYASAVLAPDRGVRSLTGNLCGGAIDNHNNTTITPKRPPAVTATKALTGETSVVSILTSVTVCRHDRWPPSAGFKKSMRRAA